MKPDVDTATRRLESTGAAVRQSEILVIPGFEDSMAWYVNTAPDEQPHWHVTFAVEDRDQTAARAEQLGAGVLDQNDEEWSRTARIRDPQGAEFPASQFTPPSG